MDDAKNSSGGLEDSPFSFRENKDGKVFISWRGSPVMTLKGSKAAAFLRRISGLGELRQQKIMARINGNFKR